jgi:hypothetical protein
VGRLLVIANVVPSPQILITLMMEALRSPKCRFLQDPHGVTSQNTAFCTENTMFRKLDLFPSSGEGRKKVTLLALSKGPNRVGVFLPSPEDGNRSSFRNVVFSGF